MNKITIRDKQLESKTFCVLPWNHLHTTPTGYFKPCCNSNLHGSMVPDTVDELMNSAYMKEVRLKMLAGEEVNGCDICYKQELATNDSPRLHFNKKYKDYIDEDVKNNTLFNGGLEKIKLRYIDVRTSNICNFKCRYCGPDYSSKWTQEISKHGNFMQLKDVIPTKNEHSLIDDLVLYLNAVETVYFAGGEPLITDEHYTLLETLKELEDKPELFYSTNLSMLDYKEYDIIELWKNFPYVNVTASIDHIGNRAEYMRHGTVWKEVAENLKKLEDLCAAQSDETIVFNIHILVTNFNFLTLTDLLNYIDHNLPHSLLQVNYCINPQELSLLCMPQNLLDEGSIKLKEYIDNSNHSDTNRNLELNKILSYASQESAWDLNKEQFALVNKHLDTVRNESFTETFPELKEMWYE